MSLSVYCKQSFIYFLKYVHLCSRRECVHLSVNTRRGQRHQVLWSWYWDLNCCPLKEQSQLLSHTSLGTTNKSFSPLFHIHLEGPRNQQDVSHI